MASRRVALEALAATCCAARAATVIPQRSAAALRTLATRTLPTTQLHRPAVVSVAPRRWYSARSDENTVPGSKLWNFEEMKAQAALAGKDSDIVLVDVREPAELAETGKIPGAINIPITSAVQSFHISEEDFEDMYGFQRPSKDKTLVFYCKAGVRARSAAALAVHAGWSQVGEYPGSWLDWRSQQGPVENVYGFPGKEKELPEH